jgi:hypothetical protein
MKMNIIEAFQSGQRFRLKGMSRWFYRVAHDHTKNKYLVLVYSDYPIEGLFNTKGFELLQPRNEGVAFERLMLNEFISNDWETEI